jgi:hypothetical protein
MVAEVRSNGFLDQTMAAGAIASRYTVFTGLAAGSLYYTHFVAQHVLNRLGLFVGVAEVIRVGIVFHLMKQAVPENQVAQRVDAVLRFFFWSRVVMSGLLIGLVVPSLLYSAAYLRIALCAKNAFGVLWSLTVLTFKIGYVWPLVHLPSPSELSEGPSSQGNKLHEWLVSRPSPPLYSEPLLSALRSRCVVPIPEDADNEPLMDLCRVGFRITTFHALALRLGLLDLTDENVIIRVNHYLKQQGLRVVRHSNKIIFWSSWMASFQRKKPSSSGLRTSVTCQLLKSELGPRSTLCLTGL